MEESSAITISRDLKRWWPAELVERLDFAEEKLGAIQAAFEIYQEAGHNAQARCKAVKGKSTVTNYLPAFVLNGLASREYDTMKLVNKILASKQEFGTEGMWVNARDSQGSSLLEIFGAQRGELERAKQLIKLGADDESIGRTFIRACTGPHLHVAQYLWNKKKLDYDLVNALVGAAGHGNQESMKWLFEIGADKFKFDGGGSFCEIIKAVQQHHAEEFNATPALLMAAHYGHLEACKHLLQNKFCPEVLLAAFNAAATGGQIGVLPFLAKKIKKGELKERWLAMAGAGAVSVLGAILSQVCDGGQVANHPLALRGLLEAAKNNQSDAIELLVNRGVNVNGKPQQSTALTHAASLGHTEAVLTLLELGAEDKERALRIAQLNKHPLTAEILGGNKALNNEGELVTAAIKGHIRLATYLLQHKQSDVDETNEYGETALMHAIFRGCNQSIDLLLEAGADINIRSDSGSTAYTVAIAKGHHEIAARLKPPSNLPLYLLLASALILVGSHQLWAHRAKIQTLFRTS